MKVIKSEKINFLIPLTFFCLWLTGFSSDKVEQILALVFIFSFGILHGANDLMLIQNLRHTVSTSAKSKILILYVVVVLVIAGLFYAIPQFALWLFILYSAYHFGEQHWVGRLSDTSPLVQFYFLAYGFLILFMLFYLNAQEVSIIMKEITGKEVPIKIFEVGFWLNATVFGVLSLFLFRGILLLKLLPIELLLLGIFWIVFKTASLLWAFAIYFILWHAIPSLLDQIKILYGTANRENGRKYLSSAALYWIAALISLSAAYILFNDPSYGFVSIFFSFLAAITFPHVIVISRFLSRSGTVDKP